MAWCFNTLLEKGASGKTKLIAPLWGRANLDIRKGPLIRGKERNNRSLGLRLRKNLSSVKTFFEREGQHFLLLAFIGKFVKVFMIMNLHLKDLTFETLQSFFH